MLDLSGEMYKPVKTAAPIGESRDFPLRGPRFTQIPLELLHKVTPYHRRSFGSEIINGKVVFSDEFGNRFTSITVKGVPPLNEIPFIRQDWCCSSGYRTEFMCDTIEAEHINAISQDLRSHGLNTEHISKSTNLTHLQYGDTRIGIPDLIKQLRTAFLDQNPQIKNDPNELQELDNYLHSAEYVTVERILPVNERLRDLEFSQTSETFKKLFASTITYYMGEHQGVKLDSSPQSIFNYLTEVLPSKMGTYLGKFNRLGYVHRFATDHNWLLTGELCDLDGVQKIENPESSTLNDFKIDLSQTYMGLVEVYRSAFKKFCIDEGLVQENEANQKSKSIAQNAIRLFTNAYSKETGIPDNVLLDFSAKMTDSLLSTLYGD